MATALENLIAQGIPQKMAERIIAQVQKESEPKKKKGNFFPGMSSSSKKVDLEIEVTTICECCGDTQVSTRTILANADSPKTLKTATMLCDKCPDYFRALTHEQLVSLALVRHHAGIMHQHPRDKSQVKFAKNNTPEEIVHLRLNVH